MHRQSPRTKGSKKKKSMKKHSFLRLGALGGILTNSQTVMAWDRPVRAWRTYLEDATYLAIEFCARVHTDDGKYGS